MTEYAAHIPRDTFETSICREAIETRLRTWRGLGSISDVVIDAETARPGEWIFKVYGPVDPGPVNLRDLDSFPQPVRGIAYIRADLDRATVYWEIEEQPRCFRQSNSGEWSPVVRWGTTNVH